MRVLYMTYTHKRINNFLNNHKGFTLIETVIALAILSIGLMAIMALQTTSLKTSFKARKVTYSAFQGTDMVEKLMANNFDQVNPFNSADLNQPHTITDGKCITQYTVSNNDSPIPNVKTITVSSWWVDGNQTAQKGLRTYVYYKADKF